MSDKLISKIPDGPLEQKWSKRKSEIHLVSPNNKRKLEIIVVGTGLGGASAAASLGELGYNVKIFCISDTPRRAHSIAAQGGINAAKNYQNDNDSVYRLFYDTIKGGDYRAREANVYRLAEVSAAIIDQCVAQGIPFAREYGGYLANRSFGGVQVSRTFYARGQTGQQLLLGAYASLNKEIAAGTVKSYPRHEMLDLVVINGQAKGIIARNLVTGKLERFGAHAVVIATGGYGNTYFLSTNAMNSNGSAAVQCYKKGAFFANPCFAQIHPTCIPVHGDQQCKLTLMSESLRNDGRIWVPKKMEDVLKLRKKEIKASQIPEQDRDYYLERRYPAFGNLVPRDVASRAAKERCDAGFGVNETGKAVFLDFSEAIKRLGHQKVAERYGNLFEMYEKITASSPWEEPMMIYPAIHYTMGGIWVDYDLQTTIPGLYAIGEANFSDHGGNRLGASALMQGLADGYFILPITIGDYLSKKFAEPKTDTNAPEFDAAEKAVSTVSSPSRARGLSIPSTRNSATLCGNTSVWHATLKVSRLQSPRSRPLRTSSTRMFTSLAATMSLTRSLKRRSDSRISSRSVCLWLTMLSTVTSPAVVISAWKARPKRERLSVTMPITCMLPLGNTRVKTRILSFTRSL